jgi:hypothetical protein
LNYEKINVKAKLIHSSSNILKDSMGHKGEILILDENRKG